MENKKVLKCTWTQELSEWVKQTYGIDLAKEMITCVGEDIIKELDNQILSEIVRKYPNFQKWEFKMTELFVVQKKVDSIEWNAVKNNEILEPEHYYTSSCCGIDEYPVKLFPTFEDTIKWINNDKDLFLKQYYNPDYQVIHANDDIDTEEFFKDPQDDCVWLDPEYYFFRTRKDSKVDDYKYYPRGISALIIRSKNPNNSHIYKPYGRYQGDICLYYVEKTYIDVNTLFGGEQRHCILKAE